MSRFITEFNPKPIDIAICGSMSHKAQRLQIIDDLQNIGFSVSAPDLSENTDWSLISDEEMIVKKGKLVRRHIANIATAKAVLIANYEKNGIDNYIGSNSFLEMGAAFIFKNRSTY